MMINRPGWHCILAKSAGGQSIGRNVYVQQAQAGLYEKLKADMQANFHLVTLFRAINALNAQPLSGESIVPAGTIRHLEKNGMRLEYYLEGGDVLIKGLEFGSHFNEPSGDQATALYHVARTENEWTLNDRFKKEGSLDFSAKNKWGHAHYAAVSGKMANKERAGQLLGDHITGAYQKINELSEGDVKAAQNKGRQYSLYWVNGDHKSVNAKSGLSSLIQQAADAKKPVNWLVHGEGAATLEAALTVLKDAPSLTRFAAKDEQIVKNLRDTMAQQKIFLSNPKGANVKSIAKLAKIVGVTFDEKKMVNHNNRDLTNPNFYRNHQKEIVKIGKKVAEDHKTYFMGAAGGGALTAGYDKIDAAVNAVIADPMSAGTAIALGTTIVGTYMAVKKAAQKNIAFAKGVGAAYSSTMKDGNDYWYTSDADLLKQLKG